MTERSLRFFWFHPEGPDGPKFNHLDLTGFEVLALEQRLGIEWGDLRPVANVGHRMAILETFLARSDQEKAAARIGAMTMAELEEAVTVEWDAQDDLPTTYEDGLPKAEDAT